MSNDTRQALAALPERDYTKPAEQQGLFRKFDVRRTDGSDATPMGKHYGCEYFVLDINHDQHAKAALAAYADAVKATHPDLAKDMRSRYALSAQPVAGAVATEPSEEIQELRAQVEAWRKQCETLTNQVICCGVAARHPDATLTTRGAYAGKWNSPQAEEVRKLRAERDALLAASPHPEPSAQAVMMELEQRLIEIAKALPPMTTLGWNDGGMCEPDEAIKGYTKKQVLEILAQHLSTSPHPEPSAQGEPVAGAVAQPTPNFSIIWTICRFALHSPTEVLMHQIERLANELHGEEQQKLLALLIRARNPQAQKPATKLVPSAAPAPEPSAQAVLLREAMDRTWHVLKKHGKHPGRTDDTLWDCVDAALAASPQSAQGEPVAPLAPTHYCTVCGANWRQCDDGSWNLRSEKAGPCCDNAPMGEQIKPLVPEPSAQGEPVATVTEEMVTAYLTANDAYWKRIDSEPTKLGKWRNGTPSEATRVSLMAALAAAPSTPPPAVVEAVPLTDDRIDDIWAGCSDNDDGVNIHTLARAVERAVLEANGIAPKAAQEKP